MPGFVGRKDIFVLFVWFRFLKFQWFNFPKPEGNWKLDYKVSKINSKIEVFTG